LLKNFDKDLSTVRNKFALERVKAIKRLSVGVIEFESALDKLRVGYSRLGISEIEYRPIYIASYIAKKQVNRLKNELKKDNIEFLTLEEVLEEVIKDIDDWKER